MPRTCAVCSNTDLISAVPALISVAANWAIVLCKCQVAMPTVIFLRWSPWMEGLHLLHAFKVYHNTLGPDMAAGTLSHRIRPLPLNCLIRRRPRLHLRQNRRARALLCTAQDRAWV
jgi:hypothetical protein